MSIFNLFNKQQTQAIVPSTPAPVAEPINHIKKLKAELKVLSSSIREMKSKRKESNGYVHGLYNAQLDYRIKHIARCLLRGRTIDQIENKLREPKSSTHLWVRNRANKMYESLKEEVQLEQALRANQTRST